MVNGYVKLDREYLHNGLLQDAELWQLYSYLMLKATYQERTIIFNGSTVKLYSGESIMGRKKAAQDLNTSEGKIRNKINKLETLELLTKRTTNKYTVVNLVRWGLEQCDNRQSNQKTDQSTTSTQPALNHKQEVKKERKKEVSNVDTQHIELSKLLFELKKENNPKVKEPNYNTWGNHIRLMVEQDNYTIDEIEELIRFSQKDGFWKKNILSTQKLREKAEQLTMKMMDEKPKQLNKNKIEPATIKDVEPIKEEIVDLSKYGGWNG